MNFEFLGSFHDLGLCGAVRTRRFSVQGFPNAACDGAVQNTENIQKNCKERVRIVLLDGTINIM